MVFEAIGIHRMYDKNSILRAVHLRQNFFDKHLLNRGSRIALGPVNARRDHEKPARSFERSQIHIVDGKGVVPAARDLPLPQGSLKSGSKVAENLAARVVICRKI